MDLKALIDERRRACRTPRALHQTAADRTAEGRHGDAVVLALDYFANTNEASSIDLAGISLANLVVARDAAAPEARTATTRTLASAWTAADAPVPALAVVGPAMTHVLEFYRLEPGETQRLATTFAVFALAGLGAPDATLTAVEAVDPTIWSEFARRRAPVTIYRAGHFTPALRLLERMGLGEAFLARNIRSQLEMWRIARTEVALPAPRPGARPPAARPARILLPVHNTIQFDNAGYAIRGHGLLSALAAARPDFDLNVIGRPGYPWDRKDAEVIRRRPLSETIDGVRYDCFPESVYEDLHGLTQRDRLDAYGDLLSARAERDGAALLHACANYFNGYAAAIAAQRTGAAYVYEVRGLWEVTRRSREPAWAGTEQHDAMVAMEATVARKADRVICITEPLAEIMTARGVDPTRIVVVPNGVDTRAFQPASPGAPDALREIGVDRRGRLVVGFIGSVVAYEGLDLLVEAVARLPHEVRERLLVVIIGDGAHFDPVQRLVQQHGLSDTIAMPGRVPFEAVRGFYAAFDMCVYPRCGIEVCEVVSPLKPFEAMAMAKPILVSSARAVSDFVRDGETGFVFEKDDPDALARALTQAVAAPSALPAAGAAAREWVERERDWRQIAETVAGVYDALLG